MTRQKTIVTAALNGVHTDPKNFPVPVTPEEMAQAAEEAWNAGATIVHCHFRDQREGRGALPTWDLPTVEAICGAIRARVPKLLINMSTGVLGPDISGPVACLEKIKPDMAAMNAGSLNYLKTKNDGSWAWKPMLFDNPIEKISGFLEVMNRNGIIPECECFDTGIVRSIAMLEQVGLLKPPYGISLVMGVASGMPAKPQWLPLLVDELPRGANWQLIAIGRSEVWELQRKACELGGHVRTGVEDTLYLPNGEKTFSNGKLVQALVQLVREAGSDVASPEETREILGHP